MTTATEVRNGTAAKVQTPPSLTDALIALQGELPAVPKDANNPHFKTKYASLAGIMETVQPLLTKHGFAWTTLPGADADGRPNLVYRLIHASGEEINGTLPLQMDKATPQGQGSAITYARRYALSSVLNLVTDDDDGNAASAQRTTEAQAPQRAPQNAAQGDGVKKLDPCPICAAEGIETKKGETSHLYRKAGFPIQCNGWANGTFLNHTIADISRFNDDGQDDYPDGDPSQFEAFRSETAERMDS